MAVSAISFEDQNTFEEKQVVSDADIQTKSVGVTALALTSSDFLLSTLRGELTT